MLHFGTLEDKGDEAEAVGPLHVADKRNLFSICRVVRIVQSLNAFEWKSNLHGGENSLFVAGEEFGNEECVGAE